MQRTLILASASPRRAEILTQIGVPFTTCAADVDETPLAQESVEDLVIRLSCAKAAAVQDRFQDHCILASDTVVVSDEGELFGKPIDGPDAVRMLMQLSGRQHRVVTGLVVQQGGRILTGMSVTRVNMVSFSEADALAYWNTDEPKGKAGGYAIQGFGAALIAGIEGSYTGVVGLPVDVVVPLLKQFHMEIWQTQPAEVRL